MKKYIIFTILFILYLIPDVYTQEIKSTLCNPPIPVSGSPDWGVDYVVSENEPMGRPNGIYKTSSNKLFVCIPDTNYSSGKAIVCLVSTNNGANWNLLSYITPAFITPKVDMVLTGTDSVYCFFTYETTIYSWNVETGTLNQFTNYTNIRDYDAEASSTGGLYLIIDLNISNAVYVFGSANYGVTWTQSSYMSSAAAHPCWSKTLYGDTLLISYYGPIAGLTDTTTAAIRVVRYRETTIGTLAVTGSFLTVVTAGSPKPQFRPVINGTNAWLFYSQGTQGNIDLYCMVSTNMGVAFGTAFTVTNPPGRDEYWFDAKPYMLNPGGVDLIFYSDSLQGGSPTNTTDKLLYSYATNNLPSTFSGFEQISGFPPEWSIRGYIPSLIEYYNTAGDFGALWVGVSGSSKKLYYDRYLSFSKVKKDYTTTPEKYYLGQNYPNPFNPKTKIDFSIIKNSLVTIKVYDILGKEVDLITNEVLSAGKYTIDYDGSKLSSGIYFYKIFAGEFSETRKMILIK